MCSATRGTSDRQTAPCMHLLFWSSLCLIVCGIWRAERVAAQRNGGYTKGFRVYHVPLTMREKGGGVQRKRVAGGEYAALCLCQE